MLWRQAGETSEFLTWIFSCRERLAVQLEYKRSAPESVVVFLIGAGGQTVERHYSGIRRPRASYRANFGSFFWTLGAPGSRSGRPLLD